MGKGIEMFRYFIAFILMSAFLFKFGDAAVTFTKPENGDSSVDLNENAAENDAVETITASSDITSSVSFTLITTGTPFALATDGALTVASATLDYETTKSYVLFIQGVDDSSTATATLTVNILDVDDEDPSFAAASYEICVLDGSAVDSTVTTFSATDPDTDDASLMYSITGGDTNSDFAIKTKYLTVAKELDRGTTPSYTLKIQVSDGTRTDTANFVVTVSTSCESAASALVASLAALLIGLVCAMN